MLFSEAVRAFIFHCSVERRLSQHTVAAYSSDLLDLARFLGDDNDVNSVSVQALQRYLSILSGERNLSALTTKRRLACQRAFWKYLSSSYGLNNPFDNWSPSIKSPKRLPRALSQPETTELINVPIERGNRDSNSCESHRVTLLAVFVILATGLRVSELCSICTSDVSSDGAIIQIRGKGDRDRVVYVVDRNIKQELKRELASRISRPAKSLHLFLNMRGRPLTPQTLRLRLHRMTSGANMERSVTPHMLRHTAATMLIEQGVDIRFVQKLLGHRSIATTEIYTHVTDNSLRAALDKADALVGLLSQTRFANSIS